MGMKIDKFKCDHDIRETCVNCDGPPLEYWESISGLIDQSLIDEIEEEFLSKGGKESHKKFLSNWE